MRREIRALLRQLGPGWHIQRHTGSGHVLLTHRSGATVTAAATPSCPRSRRNTIADARRALAAMQGRANA